MSKKVLKILLIIGIICSFSFITSVNALDCLRGRNPEIGECVMTKDEYDDWKNSNSSNGSTTNTGKSEVFNADPDFSCDNPRIKKAVSIIAEILFWLRIIAPIIIVIMGSVSFAKAVISEDDNDIKTVFYALLKKVVLGALIFVLPTIVIAIMKDVAKDKYTEDGEGNWADCVILLK